MIYPFCSNFIRVHCKIYVVINLYFPAYTKVSIQSCVVNASKVSIQSCVVNSSKVSIQSCVVNASKVSWHLNNKEQYDTLLFL